MRILLSIAILAGTTGWSEAQERSTVKLDQRTDSKYLNSAYSFRYRTQEAQSHKNYVDIVYEAGIMRINNHGGQKNMIADLGPMEGLNQANDVQQQDADWTDQMLVPQRGHTYALDINADNNRMLVVFHVTNVSAEQLEFDWTMVSGNYNWPDLRRRGAAGTSGMMAAFQSERPKPKYRIGDQ